MGSVVGELSPTPASLTDLMQNSYSFPVLSPGTVNLEETWASFQGRPDIPELSRTTCGISGPQQWDLRVLETSSYLKILALAPQ